MLVLIAYMDESGHSKDPKSRFSGMAGLIAEGDAWEQLEATWNSALAEAGIKNGFHMKDFAHRQGEFKDWKESGRRHLFSKLVTAITDAKAIPVGCVVSLDCFNGAPQLLKDFFHEPYFMSFQMVTRGAALQALPKEVPYVPETVAMVYAYQEEFGATAARAEADNRKAGAAQELWREMKRLTMYGRWMGSYSSEFPKNLCPLQAADLFAYELNKEFENLVNRPQDDMRWALSTILRPIADRGRSHLIQFFDSYEMIRTFLEATGQDSNPELQGLLTVAWTNKLSVRQLLQERIEKHAKD
jgi:hypothetical protein